MSREDSLSGYNAITGEWNDSLRGEFLWSSANTREAIPDVMTPSTWSLWQIYYVDTNPVHLPGKFPFCGNICGRPYLNLSLVISMYRAVGRDFRSEMHGDIIGLVHRDIDIPVIPFTPLSVIWNVLPGMIKARRYARPGGRALSIFFSTTPNLCRDVRAQITNARDQGELSLLWSRTIRPVFSHACSILRSVTMQFTDPYNRLRLDLCRLLGAEDANTLLSCVTVRAANLESLAPLLGLSKVLRGEMKREAYLEHYGHRGPHELELFAPGTDEDPGWLDRQIENLEQSGIDVEFLQERQHAEFERAWNRLKSKYSGQSSKIKVRLEEVASASRHREAVRSEVTRLTRLVRQFLLRAGEITGLGDGIFFLTIDEMYSLLTGDKTYCIRIPARREAYQRYSELPPYPPIIIGSFDPFAWASDPNHRNDIFDSRKRTQKDSSIPATITGFPGAAGIVEGIVRRIDHVEDGNQIQPGEILVTSVTNIGWTPIFPRLAAIITDIGAPLSHAAIVARELGIPAVVGCGNATMLLKTGDRVRVDGGTGTVEILTG